MGIVVKQSGVSAIITYIGAFIGFANTIILFPAFLSEEQIGLIRVIPSIAYMLMPLAQIGLPHALIKFFPELKNNQLAKQQFLTLALFGILSGVLVVFGILTIFDDVVFSYFSKNAPTLNEYFLVVLAMILILAVRVFLEAYSRVLLKIIAINVIKEILIRVLLSVAVSLYFLKIIEFNELVNGLILIHSIALISLLLYVIKIGEFRLSIKFDQISKDFVRRVFNFAAFIIIGASAGNIVLNLDQLMISSMLGLDQNGIYTTVFYFAVMIELSRRAITQITTPLVAKSFEIKDTIVIKKIYQQTSINQMIIGSLFFIGIIINIDSVFNLMPNGDAFRAGKYVIYIIGISKLLDMTFANNSEIITMSDHYKFNVVSLIFLAVLLILFNLIFIPVYGINGAAIASMLAVLIFNLLKFIFIKTKLGFHPFTNKTFLQLLIIGITTYLGFIIPSFESPIVDIMVRSAAVCAVFGSLVYFLKISQEINGLINKLLEYLRLKS